MQITIIFAQTMPKNYKILYKKITQKIHLCLVFVKFLPKLQINLLFSKILCKIVYLIKKNNLNLKES